MESKEEFLKDILTKNDFVYLPLEGDTLDIVYDIYKTGDVHKNETDPVILREIGTYYCIKKYFKLSKEYYKKAIDAGSIESLYNLGYCYYLEENYEKMIKYFKLAADKNVYLQW